MYFVTFLYFKFQGLLKNMDPSLLREREAFLKKAKTTVLIEKPRVEKVQSPENCVVVCTASSRPVAYNSVIDFRSLEVRPQLQGKFAVLSRIVKYMKVQSKFIGLHIVAKAFRTRYSPIIS